MTLRVDNACWMLLSHPDGKELVFGIEAPSQVRDRASIGPEGHLHPGAELVAFLPISDQSPSPLAIIPDLEHPFYKTSEGQNWTLSLFRDDEYKPIVQFKVMIELEKS